MLLGGKKNHLNCMSLEILPEIAGTDESEVTTSTAKTTDSPITCGNEPSCQLNLGIGARINQP